MNKVAKTFATIALALIGGSLFAYNGGYENCIPTNTVIGGVTYKGYGNYTVTAREESGSAIAANKYAQCKALKSVDLTGVTSIGDAAFAYSALETVTIPSTVSSMGFIAFGGCTNLTQVAVNNFSWYNSSTEPFRDCTKLTTLVANCAPPSLDAAAFKDLFSSVTTVKVPLAQKTAWPAKCYGITVQGTSSSVKVTLDAQGGSCAYASVWYVYGKTPGGYYYFTDDACTKGLAGPTVGKPTRHGYAFGGFYTGKNGTGVQYVNANGGFVNNLWSKSSADVTLYAKWTAVAGQCRVTSVAVPSASCTSLEDTFVPSIISGMFADGSGYYELILDEDLENGYVHIVNETEDRYFECSVDVLDNLVLVCDQDGNVYCLPIN